MNTLSQFVDRLSEFLARRKGLIPMTGIGLVLLNLVVRLASHGWLARSDLFLHLGIIVAIIGIMLAWAL